MLFFSFYNKLIVRLTGRLNTLAAKRFINRYKYYQINPDCVTDDKKIDLTIDITPFSFNKKTYLIGQYKIAQDYLARVSSYKGAKWQYEIDGFGKFPSTIRIWGNTLAHFTITDITLSNMLIWYLSLKDMIPIHAASVAKDGNAIILAGRRGVGKTMIIPKILKHHYKMISEDRVFLHQKQVNAFRLPVNIKFDRKNPEIAKLPVNSKINLVRNRLISILTFGKINLLEPLSIEKKISDNLDDLGKLSKFIYLQSGPSLQIENNISTQKISNQVIDGNLFDFSLLASDIAHYQFCFPKINYDLWESHKQLLNRELIDVPALKITVPIKPAEDQWATIVEEILK